uniref:Transcriptional regulator, TetR family n=1 Tax=uncultured Chloroflexota bacterium TaxID=166587 RepID=H5SIC9_9CHLR|nr:transcriptional regulator, TetR family [uncultured Chloroflexota bacterium]BAL55915.1 transcriptional regulator, TetR family [uncultured Chloroflexota bacterium]
MPKETFFNLPEEKRELICAAALEEFAAHPFRHASINRIVRRAGIAKGSFYQYFEDKTDLFLYLLKKAGELKMRYLAPLLQETENMDFFSLLRKLYLGGLQMAVEHPLYAALGKRLLEERALYQKIWAESAPVALDFFRPLLEKAAAKREIRTDLDLTFLSWLVTHLSGHLQEYYLEQVADQYDLRMMEVVDQLISFLQRGLQPLP